MTADAFADDIRKAEAAGMNGHISKPVDIGKLEEALEAVDTVDRDKNESSARFPVNLFCSLMLLSFIPFLYTLVRTNLIANGPVTDGLGIAGAHGMV